MTNEQRELKIAWITIMTILKETGYDFMYQDEISKVSKVIRKELGFN